MGKVSFQAPGSVAEVTEAVPVIESTTTVNGVSTTAPTPPPAEVFDASPAAAVPGTTSLPAVVPSKAVQSSSAFADDTNIDLRDINLPRLNIVQKVGELSNIFTPGEIVLNLQQPVYTPPVLKDGVVVKPGTEPLVFTVVGFRPLQYVEKVPGGGLGELCNSEAELAQHNGTLDYGEHDNRKANGLPSKLFQKMATALCIVQRPAHLAQLDEDNILFSQEHDGQYYTLAIFAMKGTAFTAAAKTLFTARRTGHLKGGYLNYSWAISTSLKKFGENFAWVPKLTNGHKNSPEFIAFTREILGA